MNNSEQISPDYRICGKTCKEYIFKEINKNIHALALLAELKNRVDESRIEKILKHGKFIVGDLYRNLRPFLLELGMSTFELYNGFHSPNDEDDIENCISLFFASYILPHLSRKQNLGFLSEPLTSDDSISGYRECKEGSKFMDAWSFMFALGETEGKVPPKGFRLLNKPLSILVRLFKDFLRDFWRKTDNGKFSRRKSFKGRPRCRVLCMADFEDNLELHEIAIDNDCTRNRIILSVDGKRLIELLHDDLWACLPVAL